MSIIIKIRENESFTESERLVAKYIVQNYKNIKLLNQDIISKNTFTSISTVTRMCKKIGFKGFKDFKIQLIEEISNLEKKETSFDVKDIENLSDIKSIIQTINSISIDSLKENIMLQDEKIIEKIIMLIENHEIIDLYGMGASYLVCLDMQYKFLRLGLQVNCFATTDLQYVNAKSSNEKHLSIIISYSGMTKEMIEISKILEDKMIETISITRYTENELIKHCKYNLYVTSKEELKRSAAVYSRISMLNLIDVIYYSFFNKHYNKFKKNIYETEIKK